MSNGSFTYSYSGEIRDYLDSVSELFKKLLRRGLMILKDLPTAEMIDERTSAIVLLYRNAMALLDALAEVSSLPSVEAFKVVFRSFFETKCTIEYILDCDALDRAVAYQTKHIMNRIEQYEKYDSSTEAGKKFVSKLQQDRLFGSIDLVRIDTQDAITNLKKQLQYEPFKTAYEKLRTGKSKNWYSINGGPRNLYELCEHLHYSAAYDYLYRQLSETTHATGAYVSSFFGQEGEGKMHALRALAGYQDVIKIALPLTVDFFLQTTKKLMPAHHDRLARFYKNIYRPFWKKYVENIKIERQRES
jgi:hypothetical protein